jgi:hypothetical protein
MQTQKKGGWCRIAARKYRVIAVILSVMFPPGKCKPIIQEIEARKSRNKQECE